MRSLGGQTGRVLYGDAVAGDAPRLSHPANPAPLSRTLDYVPRFTHTYFAPAFTSPNIIADAAGGPDVLGGPAPLGVLPNIAGDPLLAAAVSAMPANTLAVVMRYDAGPVGFTQKYNIDLVFAAADSLDMYLVYNVTPNVAGVRWNGERIAALPFSSRAEFGGAGVGTPTPLTTNTAWAVLGPESLSPMSVAIRFAGYDQTVSLGVPLANGATHAYIIAVVPCNLADITDVGDSGDGPDGQLTLDDILSFVNAYNDGSGCPGTPGEPCNQADVTDVGETGAGPDGELTLDDILAFVNAYSVGC